MTECRELWQVYATAMPAIFDRIPSEIITLLFTFLHPNTIMMFLGMFRTGIVKPESAPSLPPIVKITLSQTAHGWHGAFGANMCPNLIELEVNEWSLGHLAADNMVEVLKDVAMNCPALQVVSVHCCELPLHLLLPGLRAMTNLRLLRIEADGRDGLIDSSDILTLRQQSPGLQFQCSNRWHMFDSARGGVFREL
jgi:hypothetical protein